MIALFYIAEVQHSRVANEKMRVTYRFAESVSRSNEVCTCSMGSQDPAC
jgi:hypothetical protein